MMQETQIPPCSLCGAPAYSRCDHCQHLICEEHERLGISRERKRQRLCPRCDDQYTAQLVNREIPRAQRSQQGTRTLRAIQRRS